MDNPKSIFTHYTLQWQDNYYLYILWQTQGFLQSHELSQICTILQLYIHAGRVPLPALPNAGQGHVYTGQSQQENEHQRHGGNDQTEHEGWRGVPLVGASNKEFIPAVDVAMRSADQ